MTPREQHVRGEITELLDGRVGSRRRAEVEKHLETCDECRREWQALASVRAAVRSSVTRQNLPEDLGQDLRSALDREDRVASRRRPLAPRIAALATAAAVVVALLLARATDVPSSAARDWKRWTSGRLHLELRSESPHAISRFFAEQGLEFPVPAETLEVPGYRLVGARIHSLSGRRSAFYVYRNDRNKILVCQMFEGSVTALPRGARLVDRGGARLYVFRASGLTQVFWQDGPVVCGLVSDIAPEELARIALPKASRA